MYNIQQLQLLWSYAGGILIMLPWATLDCFLGAGHKCVFINKTRNIHISSFISILNKIKTKIGFYPIISYTKSNWSTFKAGHLSFDATGVTPS